MKGYYWGGHYIDVRDGERVVVTWIIKNGVEQEISVKPAANYRIHGK